MKPAIVAFNRGLLSNLAMARVDFKRTALSAEVQTNWMPRKLGSMMLRPGWGYTGGSRDNDLSVSLPFIFSRSDTARIELTDGKMRVWVDDALVSRPAVATAVTNGSFNADVSGWTDADEGSASSAWAAGGFLSLSGTVNGAARRRQQVTVAGGDQGSVHALSIEIERGPVLIRVGSSSGADDYVAEATLSTGSHSLAFTPTGDFWIELFAYNEPVALVASCTVAAAGTMELTSPWGEADLRGIRYDQSGDVIFCACSGYRQRRIERRPNNSWSIVVYQVDDGPFRVQNLGPVTITPSQTSGDITLTASKSLFKSTQIGALFRLEQSGQLETVELTGDNQFSDPIRVTGLDGTRIFAVILSGTWTGTITLQYSVGDPGDWVDAQAGSYTANTSISYDDTLDNQVIYYRIGFKSGGYGSGTATATLSYSSGSQTGIARVTSYVSPTVVNAAVLEEFGSVTATSDWAESYWSERRGFPSSVALYEGRLWWAGKDRIWGSVSDSFASHDDTTEGDSGPISRSIGSGPVDTINWLMPAQRLLLGAEGAIWVARSSSFDEPLTPTNFNLKDPITDGAYEVAALKVGSSAIYVDTGSARVFEAQYDGGSALDYGNRELTAHVPEVCEAGVIRTSVQRRPEVRCHFVLSDGTAAVLVFDKEEEVTCWIDIETDGVIEDVCVLPGTVEDQVYYTVARTIDGATVRYHEKWALESQCAGGTLNRQADAFVVGSGAVTGLDHLEGREVVIWGDGKDRGTATITGGAVAQSYSSWIAGLTYEARYKSTKLAYGLEDRGSTALGEKKRISQLGIIARNMHRVGLQFGPDFDTMDDLPATEKYARVDPDTIYAAYDEESFPFPGEWDTDSRLCLKASAPRPVTILAAIIELETNEK